MPELPEVETIRRGLNRVTLEQTLEGGDVLLSRTIAHPSSMAGFQRGIQGTQIRQWQRRGKYLLAELVQGFGQSAGWLVVHLRMTGQLLWLPRSTPLQKHTRVRFFFSPDRELRFVDTRTFGQIWWVAPEDAIETVIPTLQTLGPEPFDTTFSPNYLAQQFQQRHRPIKTLLLDQMIVAGLGNIYADEALFASGILPTTPCSALTFSQIQRLRDCIIEVLTVAIEAGGTTFSDFRNVEGINGNYQGETKVYGRGQEPCRVCQTPIQRLKLAGRSTHFCPHCQR